MVNFEKFYKAVEMTRAREAFLTAHESDSVRAIMGRISNHGSSYLITGGADKICGAA